MKIFLFTDNHFCSTSSIVRQRGIKYSLRLENQIASINWAEETSKAYNCDLVVCLGDFFDKPTLTDEEITALKEIKWNNIFHYFIVGNHESTVNGLTFNSTSALDGDKRQIVADPRVLKLNDFDELCFLPYIIESDRKPLSEYFNGCMGKRIILSHNDIKGIQMGPIISKEGFSIEEIERSCDLFINGHLHNGTKFCSNGINLGNLTGQNFGEDAFKYSHNALILDTNTLEFEYIENPYAFNFYKIDINSKDDFKNLDRIKSNSIISFKCNEKYVEDLKEYLTTFKLTDYRITSVKDDGETVPSLDIEDLTMDHLAKFVEFCKDKIGNNEVVNSELEEVCK